VPEETETRRQPKKQAVDLKAEEKALTGCGLHRNIRPVPDGEQSAER